MGDKEKEHLEKRRIANGEKNSSSVFTRFARVLNLVIFVALLFLIPLTIIPYGTVDAWWEAFFECTIFALTALWMVEVLCGRNWQIRRLAVLVPLAVITAYAFLQAVQWPPSWLMKSTTPHMLSIDQYQTFITARKALALTLFLGLLLGHTSTAKRHTWVVRTLIAVGLASAAFAILRQFLQAPDSQTGFVLPFLIYGTGYGQFISANPFAYLMEMTIGLLAGIVLGGGVSRSSVPMYVAMIAVVWTALVLSNSRGGILSLCCQAGFVLFVSLDWYSKRRLELGDEPGKAITFIRSSKLVRIFAILLLLVTVIVGVLWMGGDDLSNKLAGRTNARPEMSEEANRRQMWVASWKLFRNNMWTGTGFGAFYLGVPQFQASSGRVKLEQAHNDYLDLAASSGLVGLLLGAWFVVAVVRNSKRNFNSRSSYQRAVTLGAATALLGVAVHSFVDFGLQLTGISVVCVAVIVLFDADISHNLSRKIR